MTVKIYFKILPDYITSYDGDATIEATPDHEKRP
jgi:hypothetical protein